MVDEAGSTSSGKLESGGAPRRRVLTARPSISGEIHLSREGVVQGRRWSGRASLGRVEAFITGLRARVSPCLPSRSLLGQGKPFPGYENLSHQEWVEWLIMPIIGELQMMYDYRPPSGLDPRQRFSVEGGLEQLQRSVGCDWPIEGSSSPIGLFSPRVCGVLPRRLRVPPLVSLRELSDDDFGILHKVAVQEDGCCHWTQREPIPYRLRNTLKDFVVRARMLGDPDTVRGWTGAIKARVSS